MLTAHDNKGNIATIYNRFDGQSHSIQITRLTAQGYTLWNSVHSDNYYEKAYSSAMDSAGSLFLAGVRDSQKEKRFLLMKYDENGALVWENIDNAVSCTATTMALDREGNAVVAGVCRYWNSYPARIVKFNNDGAQLWSQDYDGGGRNYVRGLQVDYQGNISVTVETVYGNYRDGSYVTRTPVYDPAGAQLEVR